MQVTITEMSVREFAGSKDLIVRLSNDTAVCGKLLRETQNEYLMLYAGKLIVINRETHKCEVLATGVSIR